MNTPKDLLLTQLIPHPDNPRIEPRQDVIDQIAGMITGGLDPSHALIVRPVANNQYQVISGHHRALAANQARLTVVPCWIREMTDDEAYMELVRCNTQSELHPLEEGKHAAQSGMDMKAYAEAAGKKYTTLYDKVKAYRVLTVTDIRNEDAQANWSQLSQIHAAPKWLWRAMVGAMLQNSWTVAVTREQVAKYKDIGDVPEWANAKGIAQGIMSGAINKAEVGRLAVTVNQAKVSDADLVKSMHNEIIGTKPVRLSQVQSIVATWEDEQAKRDNAKRAEALAKQKAEEDAQERVANLRKNCSLDEWKTLSANERDMLMVPIKGEGGTFNKQENEAIEWAQWSWNPVTGCKHECPYCLSGDTLILMADGRTKALRDIAVGDRIIGTVAENGYRRFTETEVLAHWQTHKQAFEIALADGRTIISSGDHRFLTERGWKFAQPAEIGQRPYLTTNNSMLGIGAFTETPIVTDEYKRGYLCGIVRGDGHLKAHKDHRRIDSYMHQFRLALTDEIATERAASYLESFGVSVNWFDFTITKFADGSQKVVRAIRTSTDEAFRKICAITEITDDQSVEYLRGFVAGIFDAEGTNNGTGNVSTLRVFNSDEALLYLVEKALTFGGEFKWTYDTDKLSTNKVVRTIRIKGGLAEHVRFFQWCDPAIRRKLKIAGASIKNDLDLQVVSIRPLGVEIDMFDITTGTEDFIANGVVAHNCYARDIALSQRMAKVYPNGWNPSFRSNALNAPINTRVPNEGQTDTRFRNVFTCSMADLFGRWVPDEWIDAVLSTVRDSKEWNFLFLTKFPQRLKELSIPENAWMGTTVDLQARVANAEKAFEHVGGKVRWLSVEPMIEPLRFERLDLFNWVVIGGASSSSQTPEWRPPYRWIESLVRQCDDAGVPVYMKSNLGIANRVLQLPFSAPIKGDPQEAPSSFRYLGKDK